MQIVPKSLMLLAEMTLTSTYHCRKIKLIGEVLIGVFLFALILYVPVNNFSVMLARVFLG